MKSCLKLTFNNGQTALATQVEQPEELPYALETIGLCSSRPVLVVVGVQVTSVKLTFSVFNGCLWKF
ncbi:hypothetical protein [Nostoc sp. ChiQUE01b]|uniref:hypothetical protein n=1 Tax=Nostoc sp. ChiQUE01b TaxID=3075376 RepID=UPI002AD456B2|nr:hypothetical protein [Nostoc sp. ChiQUE01b]MDZ8260250.1 hypothetical protein [Nostoc sp. ChiQUE01b]